jgi:hypothetical protein
MASKIIVDQVQKSGLTALTLPTGNASASEFLQNDGAGALSWSSAAAGFSNMLFKTASETYTVPAGITKIVIDLISAGGGGGGSDGNWSSAGSAGSNAIKTLAVSVGQTYTITIATYGAGGTSSGSGGTGGTASFVNASGTTVNLQCTGGGGGVVNGAPGVGGTATGGDLNINGARGSSGIPAGQSAWRGASTRWGFSGGWLDVSTTSAQAGVGYGAGGCGAYYLGSASSVGADGRPGLCVITEFK